MYRQYENARQLEKELDKLKAVRDVIKKKLLSSSQTEKFLHYEIEDLTENLNAVEDKISEMEQRVNFAWQDEEFG